MNKRILDLMLVVLGVTVMLTGLVSAQTWSDSQLEVWAVIKAQWDTQAKKDANWIDQFLHEKFLGWGYEIPAPRNKLMTQDWDRYDSTNSTSHFRQLYPLGIVVSGSTAVVHYLYSQVMEDGEGNRETTHGRFTDILVREDNKWQFLAWHGGEVSSGDD